MKKQTCSLIIWCCVCLTLGIILAYFSFNPSINYPAKSTNIFPKYNKIELINSNITSVDTINIENDKGTFSVINIGDNLTIDDTNSNLWDKNKLKRLTNNVIHLVADELIESSSTHPELYRLDDPLAKVTIKLIDGNNITLTIGRKRKSDGYYLHYSQDDKIYLVNKSYISLFLDDIYGFVNYNVTPSQDTQEKIIDITLFGKCRKQPIVIKNSNKKSTVNGDTVYCITSPTQCLVSAKDIRNFTSSLVNIKCADAVKINPTQKDLTYYGLDDIYSAYDIQTEHLSYTINSSKPNKKGICYVMRNDLPIIYKMNCKHLLWFDIQMDNIIPLEYTPPKFEEISSIKIKALEENCKFIIKEKTQEDDKQEKDIEEIKTKKKTKTVMPQTKQKKIITAYFDGKEISLKNLQNFYKQITEIQPYKFSDTKIPYTSEICIDIFYANKNKKNDKIEIIEKDEKTAFLAINSKITYEVSIDYINRISNLTQNFIN